jgi:hypothetical protein
VYEALLSDVNVLSSSLFPSFFPFLKRCTSHCRAYQITNSWHGNMLSEWIIEIEES